jgi:hypothetical protein
MLGGEVHCWDWLGHAGPRWGPRKELPSLSAFCQRSTADSRQHRQEQQQQHHHHHHQPTLDQPSTSSWPAAVTPSSNRPSRHATDTPDTCHAPIAHEAHLPRPPTHAAALKQAQGDCPFMQDMDMLPRPRAAPLPARLPPAHLPGPHPPLHRHRIASHCISYLIAARPPPLPDQASLTSPALWRRYARYARCAQPKRRRTAARSAQMQITSGRAGASLTCPASGVPWSRRLSPPTIVPLGFLPPTLLPSVHWQVVSQSARYLLDRLPSLKQLATVN